MSYIREVKKEANQEQNLKTNNSIKKYMERIRHILLIFINFIGVLLSLYSLFFTETLNNFIFPGNLICDINESVSCSTTYISDYAFIFNIPISLFALLFFWFVLFFLIMNKNKDTNVQSYQTLSIINTFALIGCAYFLYILIFVLKNICISCLIIDLIVFSNFVLLFNYFKGVFNEPIKFFSKTFISNWYFNISFVVLFICGLVLYKSYQGILNTKNEKLLEAFLLQEPTEDIVSHNSIIWGNKNGKIKIRIFNDALCGYCKIASEKYRQLFSEDTTVTIEFIIYPLHYGKMNKQNHPKMNVFLAKVMLAASNDKEFWRFHDLIIKQSSDLDSARVFEIGEKSLNDFEGFKNDFFSKNFDVLLKENITLGEEYKVSGTPAIFINGRYFQQWTNINLLNMIISDYSSTKP